MAEQQSSRSPLVVPDGAVTAKVEIRDSAVIVRFFDSAGSDVGGYDVPLSAELEATSYRATAAHDTITL